MRDENCNDNNSNNSNKHNVYLHTAQIWIQPGYVSLHSICLEFCLDFRLGGGGGEGGEGRWFGEGSQWVVSFLLFVGL